MLKAKDYIRAAKDFKQIFGLHLNEYIDTMFHVDRDAVFDYWKFVGVMRERHPECSSDGISMADIVKEHYGERGASLIKKLIE